MIRTEELLAARRIDGGRQYFTRAYDFGFSQERRGDVQALAEGFDPARRRERRARVPAAGHRRRVQRHAARRPRTSSGLRRARARGVRSRGRQRAHAEQRRPTAAAPWTPPKFYRSSRFGGESTYRFDVGEYSPAARRIVRRDRRATAGRSTSRRRSGLAASQGRDHGRRAPRGIARESGRPRE